MKVERALNVVKRAINERRKQTVFQTCEDDHVDCSYEKGGACVQNALITLQLCCSLEFQSR